MKGLLVTLEGLDGSGKGTQTRMLEQALRSMGFPLCRLSFPEYDKPWSVLESMYLNGGFGTDPENVNAYAASSFFAVDRCASFLARWHADYDAGSLILADRYTTSNIVFQMPKLPHAEWDSFIAWAEDFEYVRLGIPRPDLTVFLRMPTEISQQLLHKRYSRTGGSRDIHERDLDYLENCRMGADYAVQKLGWKTVCCAENGKLRSPQSIQSELKCLVLEKLSASGWKTEVD